MKARNVCLIIILGVILLTAVDGGRGGGGSRGGGSRGSSSRGSSSRGSSSRGSSSSSSTSSRGTYEHRANKDSGESQPKVSAPSPKPPETTHVKPSAPDFKETGRPSPSAPRPDQGGQPPYNPNYPGPGAQSGGQRQPPYNPANPGAQPGGMPPQQPPPYPGAGGSQNLGNPPPYPGAGGNPNLGNPPPYPGPNQPRPPPYDTRPLPPGPGFKPGTGNPPYPVQPGTGNQPYPVQPGTGIQPYPHQPGTVNQPYPRQPGGSPYPQQPGGSPYPQQPGMGNQPYPRQPGSVYPQQHGGIYGSAPSYAQHSGFPLGGNSYSKPYKKKGLLGQVFSFGKSPKAYKPPKHGSFGGSPGIPKAMYPMMPLMMMAKKPSLHLPFNRPSFIFLPMFMPNFHHHHGYYHNIDNENYRGRCRKPFKPDNSTMDCDTTSQGASCTVQCIENYYFPDNSTSKVHQCWHVSGVWRPSRSFPQCQAICKETCLNGGTCAKPDVCTCDPEYRGERCQHHVLKCDVRKLAAENSNKIGWVCNHARNETTCKVRCRSGQFAEEPQSREYHCKIDGEWTPNTIPDCIIETNSTMPSIVV